MCRFNLKNITCVFIASSAMFLASCGGGGGSTDGGNDSLPLHSWGTAEIIGSATGGIDSQKIAIDAIGNAVAVWSQYESSGNRRIWANHYNIGSGWGVPTVIDNGVGSSNSPSVAIDNFGNAYVVWANRDGLDTIRFNIFTVNVGWGTDAPLGEGLFIESLFPRISIDSTGSALVVWTDRNNGVERNAWTSRYDNRIDRVTRQPIGWGTPQLIETNSGDVSRPKIVSDENGNTFAIWNQNNDIWVNHYIAGSGWGVAEIIGTSVDGAYNEEIVIDPTGNAMAIWVKRSGFIIQVVTNRYIDGFGWLAEEQVEGVTGVVSQPHIAISSDGNAVATWVSNVQDRSNIWANTYTINSGWGNAELVNIQNDNNAAFPRIVNDAFGNAHLVWSQSDGINVSIWANSYTSSNGWGTAELIEIGEGGATFPEIAIDAFGDGLVVWKQTDSFRFNIMSNRFE